MRRLTLATGIFDGPPASDSTNSNNADINNIPARFSSLQQVIRRERERHRASWDEATNRRRHGDQNESPTSAVLPASRSSSASLRRPPHLRHARPFRLTRPATQPLQSPPLPPLPLSSRRRARALPRNSYPSTRLRRESSARDLTNALAEMDRATESLGELSNTLSDMFDATRLPRFSLPMPNVDEYLDAYLPDIATDESEDWESMRAKRRKLNIVDKEEDASANYGYYGQVVAGPLKMNMVSCDGGVLMDDQSLYPPENILRNDRSVYCTKYRECNILLSHRGETLFDLVKLVIKSPIRGFTAPVQEGLVFVSMTSKGLVRNASRYKIGYPPPSPETATRERPRRHRPRSRERERLDGEGEIGGLTLIESLNDSELLEIHEHGEFSYHRHRDGVEGRHTLLGTEDYDNRRLERGLVDPCDYANASDDSEPEPEPSPRDFRAPTPPPPPQIRVTTTDHDDHENDLRLLESTPLEAVRDLAYRQDRWHRHYPGDEDNGDGQLPPLSSMLLQQGLDEGIASDNPLRIYAHERSPTRDDPGVRRRTTPSLIQARSSESADGSDGEIIAPQAKFFIPSDKSMMTVTFDPPISGKFILLRLFGPQPDRNIDVQNIVAYGMTGPRFFPVSQPT